MHPLDPSAYPWSRPALTGRLGPDGFRAGPPGSTRGRQPVVAVGSNASPTVLARKLAGLLESGLPIMVARVQGLSVGHSAHVSAGGYVAAAPFAQPGVRTVSLAWFDADQLGALDASEPNYCRVPLPAGMPCRTGGEPVPGGPSPAASGPVQDKPFPAVGEPVLGAQVYESVHGVLGTAGGPLELLDQAGVLAWLTARLPGLGPLDHERLRQPQVRETIRVALLESDLVLPPGL